MSEFVQAAAELLPTQQLDWLSSFQEQGRSQWLSKQFPNRKTENWKYTSLHSLAEGNYLRWSEAANHGNLKEQVSIPDFDAHRIVFVNGCYDVALSSLDLPDGLEVCSFGEASDEQQALIREHLGSVVEQGTHQFAALNASWVQEGVFIRVKSKTVVEKPVQVVYLTTAQEYNFSVQQRCLVLVEPLAEVTVLESFTSTGEAQNSFTNGVTELVVSENASLKHVRLHVEEEQALHIGGVHVSLAANARFDSFHLGLGSAVKRIDITINHEDKGTECNLNGIYLARNNQLVDYHTTIEHKAPHGRTSEVFRGIISDQAKAVFNGRIHIHKDAQKVLAELSNKNLLTSQQAEVDTKPELEIYADDVQCAHGATIAQLDDKSLYYMQARGVDRDKARILLSFGFINELINDLSDHALQVYIRHQVQFMFTDQSSDLAEVGEDVFYE